MKRKRIYDKTQFIKGLLHTGAGSVKTETAAENALKAFLEQIELALCSGYTVSLPGVGKLIPVLRRARAKTHPKTGEPTEFPPVVAVKLVLSETLRKRLQPSLLESLKQEEVEREQKKALRQRRKATGDPK